MFAIPLFIKLVCKSLCITRKGLEMFGDLEFEKVPKFWEFSSEFGSKGHFLVATQCFNWGFFRV